MPGLREEHNASTVDSRCHEDGGDDELLLEFPFNSFKDFVIEFFLGFSFLVALKFTVLVTDKVMKDSY